MNLDWLTVEPGRVPLIVSVPHAGSAILPELGGRLESLWLARKDADWHVRELYDFALGLGATLVATDLSRTVIDLNRDPSGASLYPGQTTTGLCPTETFDGELLYRAGCAPDPAEIDERTRLYHLPYHAALTFEIARLKAQFGAVALLDAHSIRSHAPRLFDGALPEINIGAYDGRSCAPELVRRIEAIFAGGPFSHVTNGRFKGGYITRAYGAPEKGVHAVQIELAMRAYLDEPADPTPANWPTAYAPARAAALRERLQAACTAMVNFAQTTGNSKESSFS
jgi:formiminoglutamase